MKCPCNGVYVCDIHDDSPTGLQEMFQQMYDDGQAEYQSVLEEIEEELRLEEQYTLSHNKDEE